MRSLICGGRLKSAGTVSNEAPTVKSGAAMREALVAKLGVLGLLSIPLVVLVFRVYAVRELLTALLFFSLFFWVMTIPLFVLTILFAASRTLVAQFMALVARLGSHLPHPIVHPTAAGKAQH